MKHPLLFLVCIVFIGCNSSNDVVSKHAISKRKYRTGFYVNTGRKTNTSVEFDNQAKPERRKKPSIKSLKNNPTASIKILQHDSAFQGLHPMQELGSDSASMLFESDKKVFPAKTSQQKVSFFKRKLKSVKAPQPSDGIEKEQNGNTWSYVTLGGILVMMVSLGWVPFFNVLLGLAFFITGIVAVAKDDNRGLAILALVSAIIFLLLTVGWSSVFLFLFTL